TDPNHPASYSLTVDNKYSRAVRTGFTRSDESVGHEFLFPLRSRESLLGVIEVAQHPREKAFFEEYRLLTEWQRDMLVQIGDIIALLLDNLRLKRELKRQSIVDPLTGAYNRNFFMTRLNSEIRRAVRYGRPISIVFIDVDLFKQVNDHYGHLQGDSVLRELGGLFRSTLRDADVLCRYGGDEFVAILPETAADTAKATAEKIRLAVRNHHFPNIDAPAQNIPVTVSLGTSTLKANQSCEEFLHDADAALYRAKEAGRDCGISDES
ncbi:MAG: sensor domain-containing diguanylate cyclase, partial [Planctomycetota bacterium]